VGIGFTIPTKKMEVASNISVRAPTAGSIASPQEMKISFTGVGADGVTPQEKAYIYSQDNTVNSLASILTFGTREGGESVVAERMRIDSSGNVGIGTSSPSSAISSVETSLKIVNNNVASLQLQASGGSGRNYVLYSGASGGLVVYDKNAESERLRIDASGNLLVGTNAGSYKVTVDAPVNLFQAYSTTHAAEIAIKGTATNVLTIAGGTGDAIAIETAGAERMRIDSNGDVLVGTTTADGHLTLKKAYGGGTAISLDTTNSGTAYVGALFRNGGSVVGSIIVSDSATAYNTSSDYRLKEDWQPMEGSIDRLMQLNPCNFAWKSSGQRVDGFLAHEAQEVVPEAVHGTKDAVDKDGNPDYQGIDQSKLVPLLTAALQEAVKRIESLEQRIITLEGNNNAI
jgi:hypothetical protein